VIANSGDGISTAVTEEVGYDSTVELTGFIPLIAQPVLTKQIKLKKAVRRYKYLFMAYLSAFC